MNKAQLSLIPKSKVILSACALLEIKHQTKFVEEFLRDNLEFLSDDLMAIYLALLNRHNAKIPVLNYGGLATKLDVLYNDDLGIHKELIMGKQLQKRKLRDPDSSKMNSAKAVLFHSDVAMLSNYYVNLSDKVRKTWDDRAQLVKLMNKPDENILTMMKFFFDSTQYVVKNSEMAVFDAIINEANLMKRIEQNPSWKNHETDRTNTIHQTLKEYHDNRMITTTDPRIIISVVLKGRMEHVADNIKFPHLTSKIFPKFWELIRETKR